MCPHPKPADDLGGLFLVTGSKTCSDCDRVYPATALVCADCHVIAGLAGCLAAILDQRLRFFDPRVRNTYLDR